MSDTPKTDQAKIAAGFQAVPESFLVFARKLERENAALRDSHAAIYFALQTHEADHTKWPEQITALRALAVEVCAIARVWATVWHDKLSLESIRRFTELEQQVLRKEGKP